MPSLLSKALITGSSVSAATTLALALLAKAEGRRAVQPLNATSHWYHGDRAARSRKVNLRHTLLGFVTHEAASVFWAAIFQRRRRARPDRAPVVDALGVAALAVIVDYAVVPRRLTPGWEKVVSPASIALAYASMALAFLATCPPRQAERGSP